MWVSSSSSQYLKVLMEHHQSDWRSLVVCHQGSVFDPLKMSGRIINRHCPKHGGVVIIEGGKVRIQKKI